jgi:hypothetical protein
MLLALYYVKRYKKVPAAQSLKIQKSGRKPGTKPGSAGVNA